MPAKSAPALSPLAERAKFAAAMLEHASVATRVHLLLILSGEECSVGDLSDRVADETGLGRPAVTVQLAKLRAAGLVEGRQDGQNRRYSVTPRGERLVEAIEVVAGA